MIGTHAAVVELEGPPGNIGKMRMDFDEAVVVICLAEWDGAPADFKEALRAYATRRPWRTKRDLCFTVAKSRLDELQRLSRACGLKRRHCPC